MADQNVSFKVVLKDGATDLEVRRIVIDRDVRFVEHPISSVTGLRFTLNG
jgi:hypothetical protein